MDFEQDLEINPEELDLEWLQQPMLYARYAQETTRLKAHADRMKEEAEVVYASVAYEVRANPEQFGLTKVTEAGVEQAIRLSRRFQEAKEAQFAAAEEAAQGFNALQALEHRKSALENLVKLHGAHYFSGPSVPHDLGRMMAEKAGDREQKNVRALMDRRRGSPK